MVLGSIPGRRRASVSHTLAADDMERPPLYLARDQVASNPRLVGQGLAVPIDVLNRTGFLRSSFVETSSIDG